MSAAGPDFSIAANPTSLSFNTGSSGTSTITLNGLSGFNNNVALNATVSPAGLSCSLIPSSVLVSTTATATLVCSGSNIGTFTAIVTGTWGSLSHSTFVTVKVQNFTISASPAIVGMNIGTAASSTISVASVNGFAGTVNLATTVSRSSVTCSLSPTSVDLANSASSTLTCSGSNAGTYTVTVVGTSGSLTETTSVTIIAVSSPQQAVNLAYFAIAIFAAGSGLAAAMVLKRFNTTYAPFEELFQFTGGECQRPATMLIIGDPGAGTTTLGLQLIHRELAAGEYCGLLTYDVFPHEVQKKMQNMGWDVSGHIKDGTLKIIDCYSALVGDEKAPVKDPVDFTEVSLQVTDIIRKAGKGPITLLLDSITPIFNSAQPRNVIDFLRVLGVKVKNKGGVFILTSTKGSIPEEVMSNLEAMVDEVIELGLKRKGESVKRTLTVQKIAGHQASLIPTEFEIATGKGILFKKHRISLKKFLWR